MNKIRKILSGTFVVVSVVMTSLFSTGFVHADGQFSVSPMNQKIILTPGETYRGSFKITNPESSEGNFSYITGITPFYVDDDYELIYQNNGDYNQIVDWISVENSEGLIAPNTTSEIYFTIDVPQNAPAGGQYAAITVTSNSNKSTDNTINIHAKYSIAHIIYAEIAGTTRRSGEIYDVNLPSFLLDGDIAGTASIKNTGNVHGTARYIMQIYPLFSNEEVYTNEEDPATRTVLPERILVNRTNWEDTPVVGIFNVIYTIEFEGDSVQVSKLVIKCPLWLLFIIILVVVALIVWIVIRIKMRKKSQDE